MKSKREAKHWPTLISSQTVYTITWLVKPWINIYVYFLVSLAVASSMAIAALQGSSINSSNISILENLLRILGGAAGGGLLTILVLRYTSRSRATLSYKAIVRRLVMLSSAAYVDVLGNYGSGPFFTSLYGSGYGPTDGSDNIEVIIGLLEEKARQLEKEEKYLTYHDWKEIKNRKYYAYGYYKYDRTKRYIDDLTNIYYRDAINNTTDKNILKELDHCTDRGLILLGMLEGDFKQSSMLWVMAHFLEVNLKLYRTLLGELGVYVEPEVEVKRHVHLA